MFKYKQLCNPRTEKGKGAIFPFLTSVAIKVESTFMFTNKVTNKKNEKNEAHRLFS